MSTPGDKNISFPDASLGKENRTSRKSAKAALFTIRAEDTVVLENAINLPCTNLLGANARGTVLGNDAHLADSQPDHPPPNLQQSTSSTTNPVCHSKFCNNIGTFKRKDVKKTDSRAQHPFCEKYNEKNRLNRNQINRRARQKKKLMKEEVLKDALSTSSKVEHGGGKK